MRRRTVIIEVEVKSGASIEQIQKYLSVYVRGTQVEIVERPKVNVIRDTKPKRVVGKTLTKAQGANYPEGPEQ